MAPIRKAYLLAKSKAYKRTARGRKRKKQTELKKSEAFQPQTSLRNTQGEKLIIKSSLYINPVCGFTKRFPYVSAEFPRGQTAQL